MVTPWRFPPITVVPNFPCKIIASIQILAKPHTSKSCHREEGGGLHFHSKTTIITPPGNTSRRLTEIGICSPRAARQMWLSAACHDFREYSDHLRICDDIPGWR